MTSGPFGLSCSFISFIVFSSLVILRYSTYQSTSSQGAKMGPTFMLNIAPYISFMVDLPSSLSASSSLSPISPSERFLFCDTWLMGVGCGATGLSSSTDLGSGHVDLGCLSTGVIGLTGSMALCGLTSASVRYLENQSSLHC